VAAVTYIWNLRSHNAEGPLVESCWLHFQAEAVVAQNWHPRGGPACVVNVTEVSSVRWLN